MYVAIKHDDLKEWEVKALHTLFSLLDKGLDDVEVGNEYTFEESFKMLEEA